MKKKNTREQRLSEALKRNLKKSIAELKKLQSDWANGYIEN